MGESQDSRPSGGLSGLDVPFASYKKLAFCLLDIFKIMDILTKEKLDLHIQKAQTLIDSDAYEEAVDELNEALKIDSRDLAALYGKGCALNELGRYEEALKVLVEVLVIDSKSVMALNSIGYALDKLNRHSEAVAAFEEALKINSKDELTLQNADIAFRNFVKYCLEMIIGKK
mgnify:CR=1 FL=1